MSGTVIRDRMYLEGEVTDFANGKFKVSTKEGHHVLCTLSGKVRQNSIKILLGDKVKVEVSEYDMSQGRIVQRQR